MVGLSSNEKRDGVNTMRVSRYFSTRATSDYIFQQIREHLLPIRGCTLTSEILEKCEQRELFGLNMPSLHYERGWGSSIDVSIRVTPHDSKIGDCNFIPKLGDKPVYLPNARIREYDIEFTFGWSSTTRDVVSALSAISLYREVVEAVATVQHAVESWAYPTAAVEALPDRSE